MKIAVLDAATLGEDLDLSPLNRLGEVDVYPTTAPEKVAERVADAEVVLINKVKLNAGNLSGAKNLKFIGIFATGFDPVDLDYCRANGIGVSNVVGYSTNNVAQITIAMAMELVNHMTEFTNFVYDGSYSASGVANKLSPTYHEFAGKKWGIVGYGNIGRKVASIAKALDCEIMAFKRTPEEGVNCVDLDTICRESDIISIHLPLNDSTRGIISAEKIALMKKNAIVINVGRGAETDEAALAAAIKEDRIAGLGVDVYSVEPFPTEHPFTEIMNLPNVCLTPHLAWGSYEARERCLDEVIKNIEAFYNGERRCRVD